MKKSKNSKQKINNENYNNELNKIIQNNIEIIIELELYIFDSGEVNILCDRDKLIKDIEKRKYYYKEIILNLQKNLIISIKIIQNYI